MCCRRANYGSFPAPAVQAKAIICLTCCYETENSTRRSGANMEICCQVFDGDINQNRCSFVIFLTQQFWQPSGVHSRVCGGHLWEQRGWLKLMKLCIHTPCCTDGLLSPNNVWWKKAPMFFLCRWNMWCDVWHATRRLRNQQRVLRSHCSEALLVKHGKNVSHSRNMHMLV